MADTEEMTTEEFMAATKTQDGYAYLVGYLAEDATPVTLRRAYESAKAHGYIKAD